MRSTPTEAADKTAAPVGARSLGQRYKSGWVFQKLDFDLHPGVTGLLGPNGAGKTTLLETLATLRSAVSGSVSFAGETHPRKPPASTLMTMGFLPQTFGYIPGFTAQECVEYAAWLKGVPSRSLPAAAAESLERLDLTDQSGKKLRHMSGGAIQRVGIAAAIVHKPAILLLDEPTVGLDPQQRIRFRDLLRGLAAEATVLLSTHLVEDVTLACERVLVLDDGRFKFDGSPAALEDIGRLEGGNDSSVSVGERGYTRLLAGTTDEARQ